MEFVLEYSSDNDFDTKSETSEISDVSDTEQLIEAIIPVIDNPRVIKNIEMKLENPIYKKINNYFLSYQDIIGMEELKKHIIEMRPKLSEKSVETYAGVIKKMHKMLFKDEPIDYHRLITHYDKVLECLKDVKPSIRKTILAGLVCISESNKTVQEKYRDLMLKDATQYNLEQKQNKMTDVQRENWIPWKDILGYVDKLKAKYYYIFKEEKPSREDILNLQKYVMLCVYTIIPPRRLQDYTLMKVKNYSKDKDNYYEKGTFYFRTYKTAKFLGMQKEKVPKNLESLLTKWIKWRGSDHLFTDYYGKEFQSAGMTKALNSIFHPKRISVNQLRHIYITEKCGPMLKQLEEVASSMGHSEGQQKLYVKNE